MNILRIDNLVYGVVLAIGIGTVLMARLASAPDKPVSKNVDPASYPWVGPWRQVFGYDSLRLIAGTEPTLGKVQLFSRGTVTDGVWAKVDGAVQISFGSKRPSLLYTVIQGEKDEFLAPIPAKSAPLEACYLRTVEQPTH